MQEYHAMIDQQDEQEKARLAKERIGYKLAKGMDYGNHQNIAAISYAEHHTNKINGQRPFDRPYGNEQRRHWENKDTHDTTYSKKTAQAWAEAGAQVFAWSAGRKLTGVANSTKATRKLFAGVWLKYTKGTL